MERYFQALNLKPGAAIQEIKKAYRALAKRFHPDTAPGGSGDVVRFQEILEAYQTLMGRGSDGGSGSRGGSWAGEAERPGRAGFWRFEGVAQDGADVIYVLRVLPAAVRTGLGVVLPLKKEEACPRCLGLGHTLAPRSAGQSLEQVPCPRCAAQGVISRNTTLRVDLRPAALREGRLRLQGLGRYRPTSAQRGDLILQFELEEGLFERTGWRVRPYVAAAKAYS